MALVMRSEIKRDVNVRILTSMATRSASESRRKSEGEDTEEEVVELEAEEVGDCW